MVTQQKLQSQAIAQKTWDKPTAQANIGDRFQIPHIAFMQVMDKDILPDGQVRLLVKPLSGGATEEWLIEPEAVIESSAPPSTHLQNTPIEQPVLDYPSCKLQPAWSAMQEYDKGTWWGKCDASARRKPLYTKASCPHSTGYLDAYNRFMQINQQSKQPPETKKPTQWQVVYAPDWDWDWYITWVEGEYIGKYCSYQEAECAAQKYIAAEQARLQHRELVLSAYAEKR